MNRACFFQNTTELASSTQLNLHEQIQPASCIRPMKNNFVRMKALISNLFIGVVPITSINITDNTSGYAIGAFIALLILGYLIYSLIKPEKF
jgi:K+-transporting ATPase KdpF subunit